MAIDDSDTGEAFGKAQHEADSNSSTSEGALVDWPTDAPNSIQTVEQLSGNSPTVSLKEQLSRMGGSLSDTLAARQIISPTLDQSLRMADAASRLSDALKSSSVLRAVEQMSTGIEKYQEAFASSGITTPVQSTNAAHDKWQEALRASPLMRAVETISTGVEKYQEVIQSSTLAKTFEAISSGIDKYRDAFESLSMRINDDYIRPFQQFQTSLARAANVALTPYLAAFGATESFSKQLQRALEPIEQISKRFASLPQLELNQFEGWFEQFSVQLQHHWNAQERRIFKLLSKRGFAGLETYLTRSELNLLLPLSKKKRNPKKRGVQPVDAFVFALFKKNN